MMILMYDKVDDFSSLSHMDRKCRSAQPVGQKYGDGGGWCDSSDELEVAATRTFARMIWIWPGHLVFCSGRKHLPVLLHVRVTGCGI
ncbi:hypothetical protein SRHO_G00264560 [Serrasalmus rhombeus]